MKKRVCIITATRAEYGLLKPVMRKMINRDEVEVDIVVTGTHLSPEFGLTFQEIEDDQIKIYEKIEILMSADTPSAVAKTMGIAMMSFSDYFSRRQPDLLIILGDRYESLAIASAATIFRIPIAHLYGGEATEGLIDEAIRHSITKMSYFHFTSNEVYRKRVIQLGESPNRVFNVGALGVENIMKQELMDWDSFKTSINLSLKEDFAVVTYHPVTLEDQSAKVQIDALLEAIDSYSNLDYIFTKANSDTNGRIINERIDEFAKSRSNCYVFDSLGLKRYLSALKYAKFVIGNSSSGLIEVPTFKIPTINIGDRQKGRIQSESVVNAETSSDSIHKAIGKALSMPTDYLAGISNPYEGENTSDQIVEIIIEALGAETINIKKKFYDIEVGDV